MWSALPCWTNIKNQCIPETCKFKWVHVLKALTWFLALPAVTLCVKVGRPLRVNLSASKLDQALQFAELASHQWSHIQGCSSTVCQDTPASTETKGARTEVVEAPTASSGEWRSVVLMLHSVLFTQNQFESLYISVYWWSTKVMFGMTMLMQV